MFQIMHKEIRGLHQAAYVLAVFTFGAQLLALIRDRLLAHQFGASIELDLYYTAFRIPDVLYVLFASTLSVYVLIPYITQRLSTASVENARALLSQIFTLFFFVYILIAACVFVFAPQIVHLFFPGFSGSEETLVLLMRILLVQPLLLGISSLYGVITQMHHRFVLYAVGPILYNLGIIAGLIFFYPHMGLAGLALGVVAGALAHVCIQIPYVLNTKLFPVWTAKFDFVEIVHICRTSFARVLTLSLHQIVLLLLVGFASIMTVGSVSVFQFAFNLQSVPLAIIGVSYSVAAFPLLSQLYAEKRMSEFGGYILNTLRHIFFWSLPTIVLFIVIRAQFVRVVLGSGEFDWNDTRLTAAILALFIISLTAQVVHLLIVRALYAVGDTRTPFYVTLFSSIATLLLAYYFYIEMIANDMFINRLETFMRLEGVVGTEVLALPLAYSCALFLHSFALLILGRKKISLSLRTLFIPFTQSTIAALCGGYVAYASLNYFVLLSTADTLLTVFMQGALAGFVGISGYVIVQYIFKNEELFEVIAMCKGRFIQKKEIPAPQDEDHLSV